ncbi:MAG: hypothetical protein MZV63_53810 [Marinilabiliales bacterium]|nr:hypothetical protein [Marinilabiliales bacterium]
MVTGIWSAPSDRLRFNVITGSERTGISWWGVPAEVLPENRRYNPAGEYTDSNGDRCVTMMMRLTITIRTITISSTPISSPDRSA